MEQKKIVSLAREVRVRHAIIGFRLDSYLRGESSIYCILHTRPHPSDIPQMISSSNLSPKSTQESFPILILLADPQDSSGTSRARTATLAPILICHPLESQDRM